MTRKKTPKKAAEPKQPRANGQAGTFYDGYQAALADVESRIEGLKVHFTEGHGDCGCGSETAVVKDDVLYEVRKLREEA